jgi:hypothetical protein
MDMKRKVQGSGSVEDVTVSGETAYKALDELKKRNSKDRAGSRDAKEMSRLQDQADRSIRINLENPLSEDAQEGGVIGLTSQHGQFFGKGKK